MKTDGKMKTGAIRIAVTVTSLLLLLCPAWLSAQERRGATIIVTRLDGVRVSGELIAVKPDSLLLLGRDGKDASVGVKDIGAVRIVRRSPTGLLTLSGFLLASGAVGMTTEPLDEWGWAYAGLAGLGGAIAGLVTGVISAKDQTLDDWGVTDGASNLNLDRLGGLSREARLSARSGPARRPRFRFGLATTMGSFADGWRSRSKDVSWNFSEEVPPGEDLPYVTAFQMSERIDDLASLGPVSLGCQWTERWAFELELSLLGKAREVLMNSYPSFTSTANGLAYQAYLHSGLRTRFDHLLVGMAYRPVVPSSGRRGSFEVGIAAGPAWVRVDSFGAILMPTAKKTVLTAQVRAAYDHHFTPSFTTGVYAAYRYGEASFPETTVIQDMTFTHWESGQDLAEPIVRRVEMTVPSREFSRSGLIYGLRIGFRI